MPICPVNSSLLFKSTVVLDEVPLAKISGASDVRSAFRTSQWGQVQQDRGESPDTAPFLREGPCKASVISQNGSPGGAGLVSSHQRCPLPPSTSRKDPVPQRIPLDGGSVNRGIPIVYLRRTKQAPIIGISENNLDFLKMLHAYKKSFYSLVQS